MRFLAVAAVALAVAPIAQPRAASLDDVAAALGTSKVDTLKFTATGKFYSVGQSERAGQAWPLANLVRLKRTMDFKSGAVREDEVVSLSDLPVRGGGGIPHVGERSRTFGIAGNQAWMMVAPTVAQANPGMMATLVHEVWTSPHGIVKAAIENKATLDGSVFAVERAGVFKSRTTVNADNLVEKVESWINNPVLGDMVVVTTYAD
jgi:hypothetical protein